MHLSQLKDKAIRRRVPFPPNDACVRHEKLGMVPCSEEAISFQSVPESQRVGGARQFPLLDKPTSVHLGVSGVVGYEQFLSSCAY